MTTKTMRAAAFGSLFALGACAHRDAVGTVDNWYHQFQGGVIAQQRPPPPGVHATYPHVGLTPTAPANVPSAPVRDSITESLIEQRNLAQRLVAANGALPTAPPTGQKTSGRSAASGTPGSPAAPAAGSPTHVSPAQGATQGTTAPRSSSPRDTTPSAIMPTGTDPSETGSNMTFDAPAQSAPARPTPVPKPAAHTATSTRPQPGDAPDLAMPAVTVRPDTADAATPLPTMPVAPPVPPQFPGFPVPTDFHLPDAPRPAFRLADPTGTLIRFSPGSDAMAGAQTSELGEIVGHRKGGLLYVHGFGEAQSLSGEDQARAIGLGLARALVVAQALETRGVPASAIILVADAVGDGVRAGTQP
jgi:hypothetical protein